MRPSASPRWVWQSTVTRRLQSRRASWYTAAGKPAPPARSVQRIKPGADVARVGKLQRAGVAVREERLLRGSRNVPAIHPVGDVRDPIRREPRPPAPFHVGERDAPPQAELTVG